MVNTELDENISVYTHLHTHIHILYKMYVQRQIYKDTHAYAYRHVQIHLNEYLHSLYEFDLPDL